MKSVGVIFIALVLALSVSVIMAEVPQMINYQGRLTTPEGEPIEDGNYTIRFTIYDDSLDGTILWAETLQVVTATGLFNTLLGSTNPIQSHIFTTPNRWLGIGVDPDPEIAPRTRFTSVAYALECDKLDGYDASYFISHAQPAASFRCYVGANGSTAVLCSAAGVLREITGIWVSGEPGVASEIKIGGDQVMNFRFSSESPNHYWSRNNGAGIIVNSGELVEYYSNGSSQATVIGFEYIP